MAETQDETQVADEALDRIAEAVRRQRLAGGDIEELRRTIASLADLETEHRVLKAGLRDLRVADTQLKDIQARAFGPVLDETAFAALPDHLRRRVLQRLANIAARMDREAVRRARLAVAPGGADPAVDPAFRCVAACRDCEAAPGGSPFWCQLSLVICLLRSVLPALLSAKSPADPARPR
jgi:hypothetical protein